MIKINKEEVISRKRSPGLDCDFCYLCRKSLNTSITWDHIIPDKLFHSNDPHRPKLRVHTLCNNLKSKEDEWFIKQLQLRSSFNKEAESEFNKTIDKAINEKRNAYIIGENVRNFKFAKTLFAGISWGLELQHGNQTLMQMKIPEENIARFRQYVETMCRGLFMLHVANSNPSTPKLIMRQNAYLEVKGVAPDVTRSIQNLIENSRGTQFGQIWGNWITYIGSRVKETPDKGYVFVQFYSQFWILATFT